MGWFEFFSGRTANVPVSPCVSEATEPCDCTTGDVDSRGHLICKCGKDHGLYLGPNTRRWW